MIGRSSATPVLVVDRVTPVKVSEAHEEAGLDEALHGEVAYLGAD